MSSDVSACFCKGSYFVHCLAISQLTTMCILKCLPKYHDVSKNSDTKYFDNQQRYDDIGTLLRKVHLSFEPVHEISNNVVCATSKASDQPAHTRSPIRAFASRLSIV